MPLEVIGAGFGRTGTESMKLALEMLGFSPCHHMREVHNNPGQLEQWKAVVHGATPDWDMVFEGYRASVDWPSSHYWRELADHYPEAKVLLTVRSPDSWIDSFSRTIGPMVREMDESRSVAPKLIGEIIFDGRPDDREHAIAIYERNTREVQAAVSPERLLTFELGDGWEPLCSFLDVPVPRQPFPRTNSTAEFLERTATSKNRPAA